MSSDTPAQRGREVVDEYAEAYAPAGQDDLDTAAALVCDVIAYLDEAGADTEYVLEQATTGAAR